MKKYISQLSSSQIIILGFAVLILLGAVLLCLPFSTQARQWTSFSDALFTATSAVCVTGLIVHDTASYWSGFGQAVIILLIQIGGMGVVTVAVALSTLSGQKVSLKQRSTMQESISAHNMGGIVELTGFIIRTSLLIELIGTAVMFPTFCRDFGFGKGLWYSLFHSVSAFCNAGFDLMGVRSPYSSLTHYISHPIINLTIVTLIVVGGIGFLTWEDIRRCKTDLRRYRMQSKVIITSTSALLLFPALYFYFFEFGSLPAGQRFWAALFQSATARTAGFNTADLTLLTESGIVIMVALMLIGGSPGSTAGGMKTTTFAVMCSTAISVFRHRSHTHFFGRRIDGDTVRSAATIVTMYTGLLIVGTVIISRTEQLPFLTCLFETASAVATVGLTLGITPQLGLLSRMILIALMYLGRVGGLTIIFATMSRNRHLTAMLPQEKLTVG
ncbi:MAG: Trk family potassium uptake protein [Oscillospiraceae bacterium]|nr:Trk family potassium uptake protein [Oscillospiraceae bacterium]